MSLPKRVATTISKEDYYTKSLEFKLYLLEYHGKYLHDLPSDESRSIFKKRFVKKWNAQELPGKCSAARCTRDRYMHVMDDLV